MLSTPGWRGVFGALANPSRPTDPPTHPRKTVLRKKKKKRQLSKGLKLVADCRYTGGMFARHVPGACPARYLCIKYLISSPKFILTEGSPPSRLH